jgi:hypothetical protein
LSGIIRQTLAYALIGSLYTVFFAVFFPYLYWNCSNEYFIPIKEPFLALLLFLHQVSDIPYKNDEEPYD